MKKKLTNHIFDKNHSFILFYLIFVLLFSQVYAQTILVQGTISVSTTTVQNALVTFIDIGDTTKQYSDLTDDSGNFQVDIIATSIGPERGSMPAKFELNQNYPNPFSATTSISYKLNRQSDVQITIYNILGRVVKKFSARGQIIGTNKFLWDGMNNFGQRLPSGIYFYQLHAGGENQIKKMILFGDAGNSSGYTPTSYHSPLSKTNQEMNMAIIGGSYNIRIENTSTTFPMIVNETMDNQGIQENSILDFTVKSFYPIANADVYVDSTHQIIRGFGAANILQWRPDMIDSEIETAFGTEIGQLGFTILRLRVQPQKNLWNTNLPSAKKAHDMGAIIIAAPWNPPDDMTEIVNGQKRLRYDMYDEYAAHLDSFAIYMEENGVPIYGISVQNEPDWGYDWTWWTSTEMLTFMRENAPAITHTKIMTPESLSFRRVMSDPILQDSTACANTDIICGHIYGGGLSAYPLAESKGKEVWMTEYLFGEEHSANNWSWAFQVAENINNVMNADMSAYVWWYIVRFYGPISDGEKAVQNPDEDYGIKGTVTKKGFVMSQFSKYIRPGFYRVDCPSRSGRYNRLSAYKNSNSEVVVVIINTGSSPNYQTVNILDGNVNSVTPFTTSTYKNCEQGEDIAVTDGKFTMLIEPSSITTFVSY